MKHTPALPLARVTLRVLTVLNWLFGGFIVALLTISFVAESWTWQALGVGSVAGHESIVAGMRAIMVIGIAGVPLANIVLRRLLTIVQSVDAGEPFAAENARRLKTIAWALLALQGLHVLVVAIGSAIATKDVQLSFGDDFDLTGWLAILLLFVLAQVFLEGTRLRDDLEGTV